MYTRLKKVLAPVLLAFLVIVATSTPAHAAYGGVLYCPFQYWGGAFTAFLRFDPHSEHGRVTSITTSVHLEGVHPGVTITKVSAPTTIDRSSPAGFYGTINAAVTFSAGGYPISTDYISCVVTKEGLLEANR